jgi:uncharacterized protein with FMN-binding domain
MKKKKAYRIMCLIVGALLIGAGIFYFTYVAPAIEQQKAVRNMQIKEVDLSKIPEGAYRGSFSFNNQYYEVEVQVKNQAIESIKVLENGTGEYAKKAEGVLQKVLSAQSLKVDAVTGATTTSKALLKATENALNEAIVE